MRRRTSLPCTSLSPMMTAASIQCQRTCLCQQTVRPNNASGTFSMVLCHAHGPGLGRGRRDHAVTRSGGNRVAPVPSMSGICPQACQDHYSIPTGPVNRPLVTPGLTEKGLAFLIGTPVLGCVLLIQARPMAFPDTPPCAGTSGTPRWSKSGSGATGPVPPVLRCSRQRYEQHRQGLS